jgi:hypothetical protein
MLLALKRKWPAYGAKLARMAPMFDPTSHVHNSLRMKTLRIVFYPTAPRRQDARIWATPLNKNGQALQGMPARKAILRNRNAYQSVPRTSPLAGVKAAAQVA